MAVRACFRVCVWVYVCLCDRQDRNNVRWYAVRFVRQRLFTLLACVRCTSYMHSIVWWYDVFADLSLTRRAHTKIHADQIPISFLFLFCTIRSLWLDPTDGYASAFRQVSHTLNGLHKQDCVAELVGFPYYATSLRSAPTHADINRATCWWVSFNLCRGQCRNMRMLWLVDVLGWLTNVYV